VIAWLLVLPALADPVALRAAGPDRAAVAAASWTDPSAGAWLGRWGGALTLHEATAVAADLAWAAPLRSRPRRGGVGSVRAVALGGALVPVVAAGVGATAGAGIEARRDGPRGHAALALTLPAAITVTAVGASTRLPVVASMAGAWPVGPVRLGALAEAGWVVTADGPGATLGRLALTVAAPLAGR